jgi:hypothetical protein
LNIRASHAEVAIMRNLSLATFLVVCAAGSAQAACYADYKAKQDDPLRLQYGVAEIRGECSATAAAGELAGRLAADGWQLLEVLGVFDESGLDERRDSAGEYFLRY